MDREKLRDSAIRYGLLFLVSMILVTGFWFHGEFYALGLIPLILIGGFVTFLVILSVRAFLTGNFPHGRARGQLPISRDTGERILAGTQTLAILPLGAAVPPVGTSANAIVAGTGTVLTRVTIRDVRRRLAGDVSGTEVEAAGYRGEADFRERWAEGKWNPREVVALVSLRRETPR